MFRMFTVWLAVAISATSLCAQSLEGTVYVTLGSGEAQLVRGTEVFLICSSPEADRVAEASLNGVRGAGNSARENMLQLMRSSPSGANGLAQIAGGTAFAKAFLTRMADALYRQLVGAQRSVTRTTFDGKYSFQRVAAGAYFLVGRHRTSFNDVLWRVPVTIAAGGNQVVDLANYNAIDLREMLASSTIEDSERFIDDMVTRFYPRQRSAFVDGQISATRQGSAASLPELLLTPLRCAGEE